ncbi:MAG: hypothetical protein ACRDAQ_03940 [Cetobacterium sp.]
MSATLDSMCNSTYLKSSFDFVSSFKNLSPNIKLVIYIICFIIFGKIIVD